MLAGCQEGTRLMIMEHAELRGLVQKVLPGIRDLRHKLHRIPEIKYHERATADLVSSFIHREGLTILPRYLDTDVVALMQGARGEGANVTLRADMDALPLNDESGTGWSSRHRGCHHACGHDGHMAMLAGSVLVLESLKDRLKGSVRFVFQPAEEEGLGGKKMVDKGVLNDSPEADAVFALHGWPGEPLGTVLSRPGVLMAAADQFELTVSGPGGHGAMPHKTVDPVVTAAQIVCGLQAVISRKLPPQQPGVISVGSIHGGSAKNVIPDYVALEGTVRYLDGRSKNIIRQGMEKTISGICDAGGAEYRFDYTDGYIPLVNDGAMVEFGKRVAVSCFGKDAYREADVPTMGAEDFAYYLDEKPGAFFWLGLGEKSPELHTPGFDFNDEALEYGITFLCGLALEFLGS